jgi:tripartite-type tricarboxylate transporter receptor subunit TctC
LVALVGDAQAEEETVVARSEPAGSLKTCTAIGSPTDRREAGDAKTKENFLPSSHRGLSFMRKWMQLRLIGMRAMKLRPRRFGWLTGAAIAGHVALAISAVAQEWPTRPVTMVIPFAAGGPVDIVGRILASRLSELLGQQVVVENLGGAGGMTGASRVAKSAPDGYQVVLGNVGTHAASQTFYKRPLYNAATDFAPVMLIAETPPVLLVRSDLPVNNLTDFITYAKANQATMQHGSGGVGSASHLACTLVNLRIGVSVTHVPYRGAAPAMQDLIAGRIDYLCPDAPIAIAQIQNKNVKAIAILTRNRSPSLPALASAHEQGLINFAASNWFALFLPKGTPVMIVQKLSAATLATMNTPAVQVRMQEIGADLVAPERRSPDYLREFVESEIEKWAAPIKASGASIN